MADDSWDDYSKLAKEKGDRMQNYLFVAIGAALGGTGRYWLANLVQSALPPNFPYGTLTVNILGSFILGVIMFTFENQLIVHLETRLFVAVGFCGSLTTFSTFSYETIKLLQDAEYLMAGLNILLNVVLTLMGIFMAFILLKKVLGV